jgi:undecaprenyl-diphosphatase
VLTAIDARVFHLLFGRDSSALTLVMIVLSMLGSGWSLLAVVPLLARPRTRRFARWLLCALVITAIAVFALKKIVMRVRPFIVFTGVRAIALDSPTDYSFPSGHAAGSFCFALFTARVLCDASPRPRYAALLSTLAVLFASAVGVSRVVLGFHFPLDVLGGAIIGGAIGAVAGVRYRTLRR